MWKSTCTEIDPVVGSVAAAVLCTVLAQHLSDSTRQTEVWSETLCWLILPSLFRVAKQSDISMIGRTISSTKPISQPSSSRSLWLVAVGVATACCYKSEVGMIVFSPALTPLLLIAEKHFLSQLQASRVANLSPFSPFANAIWGTTLTASFSILTLSNWDPQGYALSIIPVAILLAIYVALIRKADEDLLFLPVINVEDAIAPLSLRVVFILVLVLGIQTVEFGIPSNLIIPTLSSGIVKASSWYFMAQATRNTSWIIATAITTFSIISTRDSFTQSAEFQALSIVMASFIALIQIIHMLPWQAKARSTLWVLALISLFPYLSNVYAIRNAQYSAPNFGPSQQHPVEALVHSAKADFEDLLQRQSKNYTTAHGEYRRRYNVEPPPGFEAWYQFAIENKSPIIDDFDMIFDSISPFWKLSGKEVTKIISDAQNAPNSDLWHCSYSGSETKAHCVHPWRTFDRHIGLLFDKLFEGLGVALPDVNFLVNHLDEPRVLLPPLSLRGGDSHGKWNFNMTDISHQPSWDAITKFCTPQRRGTSSRSKQTVETYGLPFVTHPTLEMDLCRHPEYSAMHGLVMSPTSFSLIEGLVPILSTGSLSTMGDLLFPSPAYIESGFRYDEAHDVEWDMKQNNLYWAGSSTGGFASDNRWQFYHRQRFVKLAQNLEGRQHSYLRESGGTIHRMRSSFLNGRLFDVAFTRILQCKRKHCRDQSAYFNFKSWADKDRALQSRLVFDIDGNGISGRYYKLLASKSAPLKQTLLREWHDERLIPWVHYIPVSQHMEELPELVFYLTSTQAGQQRAKEIAEQGRMWFYRAFRDVDFGIYTYRLLLELARLQDPERQAS